MCPAARPRWLFGDGRPVRPARALGHHAASVTLNTYSHLWPSAEDKTRSAAAAMLAETLSAADSVWTADQV